jgi:hypothetical protein
MTPSAGSWVMAGGGFFLFLPQNTKPTFSKSDDAFHVNFYNFIP